MISEGGKHRGSGRSSHPNASESPATETSSNGERAAGADGSEPTGRDGHEDAGEGVAASASRLVAAQQSRRPATRSRIATMQDIAEASGVSQSTVSRVLTGAATVVPINPATRARVLEVARQLHYRPNPLARGLRGARTMLLGVIVREITDPFFAGCIDAITAEASARGYNVVLGHAHGLADEAIALRAVLETRHCDAILLLGDLSDQPRLLADLTDAHISVVGMWQGMTFPNVSTVNVDNRAGVVALVDHLHGLGHRAIGFIGGAHRPSAAAGERPLGDIRERRVAFEARLADLGVELPREYLTEMQNSLGGGAAGFERLMREAPNLTAVVASTDVLAIGALHAANRLGYRVPEDISVVGFDDLPMAEYAVPPLTTVRMPIAEMAAVAVPTAIDGMDNPDLRIERVLAPSLVIRESTGPARPVTVAAS